jgi:hypothetical protein
MDITDLDDKWVVIQLGHVVEDFPSVLQLWKDACATTLSIEYIYSLPSIFKVPYCVSMTCMNTHQAPILPD